MVEEPDKVYVSDLTYLWTQEGWLYLVVVIDLFSRQVVGWSLNNRMTKQLVMDALHMAYWRRKPPAGLIFHSDRGRQYCSTDFRKLLIPLPNQDNSISLVIVAELMKKFIMKRVNLNAKWNKILQDD
jgi:transposase InsO family protein